MEINEFRGEYAFLSNFYKSPVLYDGISYSCVECAFQAQKCANREGRLKYSLMIHLRQDLRQDLRQFF